MSCLWDLIMNKLLSVIITVYNSDKYLEICLNSVLNQTYCFLEVSLVDDGSNDRSGFICDEFAKRDSRIYVYHTVNQGSVAARNFGVSKAKGDVITFIDSDDWIETDMYQEMMNIYEKYEPDIISSGIIYDDGRDCHIEYDIFHGIYEKEKIMDEVIPVMMYDPVSHKRAVTPSVCTKLFKKSLWTGTVKNINAAITYGDDAAITYISISKANRIMFMEKVWYHYCIHGNSQVTSYAIRSFEQIREFQRYMETKFKELGVWENTWYQLKQYILLFLHAAIETIYDIDINTFFYQFPYDMVREESRIVIYGAGSVGKSYFHNFINRNYGMIAGWVDRNFKKISEAGYNIQSPEEIKNMQFDYVVIALTDANKADCVKNSLINMGVSMDKIVWKKPVCIWES